jgi:hypothetical protein
MPPVGTGTLSERDSRYAPPKTPPNFGSESKSAKKPYSRRAGCLYVLFLSSSLSAFCLGEINLAARSRTHLSTSAFSQRRKHFE